MKRENNFTFVHIFGALLVIVGHQYVLMGRAVPTVFGMALHTLGVSMLFVVSGYLITASYFRKHSRGEYLFKRIMRLYPAFVVYLLVTVPVMRLFSTQADYWASARLYLSRNLSMFPVFALSGVFTSNLSAAVNGSLWTMPVELACYLLLIPILDVYQIVARKNEKAAKCGLLCLLIGVSGFLQYQQTAMSGAVLVIWGTDIYAALQLVIYFLIGIAFYLFDFKRYANLQIAVAVAVCYVAFGNAFLFLKPYMLGYVILSFCLAEKPVFARVFKRDV